ncbi:MAG: ADOP family duplicated permease [Gemmatimonadaceae bacterium]
MPESNAGRPPGWRPLFRLPFARSRVQQEVDDEIAFHLAMRAERLRTGGLSLEQARQAAERRFGDISHVRDEMVAIDQDLGRRRNLTTYLEDLVKDLVFALRSLRRAPAFAGAALLTLALGIGSATTIFSVAYGVLLRPLPYGDADRLMEISVSLSGINAAFGTLSAPEYMDLVKGTRSFSAVGAWVPRSRTLGGDGNPERVPAASATASLFAVLGVRPVAGRLFTPEEDVPGASLVMLISQELWKRRFGADPSILGKPVMADGLHFTIVGVLPTGARIGGADAVTPMALDPARLPGRGRHFLSVVGRLRPGVTVGQAREEMAQFARQTFADHPNNYGTGGLTATARPLREAWFGNARPTMIALMTTVTLLLLLAAVNVANLLLVRAEARQREMGIRVALGASRTRLVRQFLTETVLLAGLGAAIGMPLAVIGMRSLLAINPGVIPPGAEVSLDAGVAIAAIAAIGLTAMVAGIAPALRAGATDVRSAIATGSAAGGRSGTRLRSALVSLEVALAAAMLVGAGLVGRSFQKLLSVDPGFDQRNAVVATLVLPRVRYDSAAKQVAFVNRVLEALRTLPSVSSVAAATGLPLATGHASWSVAIEGRPEAMRELSSPFFVPTTPDIFRAMGIRLLRGRAFNADDNESTPPVSIISEAMAREHFPGEDPVGKRIALSGASMPWITIVGVAADVRPEALGTPPRPTHYLLWPQYARMTGVADAGVSFVVRTSGDPSAHIAGVRQVIRQIDPELALDRVRTLEQVVTGSVARPRFAASVLAAFGASAFLLAIVGVYGVLSYAMERRRRELAVRLALGARHGQVRALVIRSGMVLAIVGVGAGIAIAALGKRVIAGLLYEVSPTDIATFAAVAGALLAAALLASWLPARRATTVSPAEVLRGD